VLLVGFAECCRWDCAMGMALSARNARNNGRLPMFYHFGSGNARKDEETDLDHVEFGDILHPVLKIMCVLMKYRCVLTGPGLDTLSLSFEKSRRLSYGSRKSNRVTGCTFRLQDQKPEFLKTITAHVRLFEADCTTVDIMSRISIQIQLM
jgi:hypothetical protein